MQKKWTRICYQLKWLDGVGTGHSWGPYTLLNIEAEVCPVWPHFFWYYLIKLHELHLLLPTFSCFNLMDSCFIDIVWNRNVHTSNTIRLYWCSLRLLASRKDPCTQLIKMLTITVFVIYCWSSRMIMGWLLFWGVLILIYWAVCND